MKSILQKLAQLKLKAIPEPWVHGVHALIAFALVKVAGHFFNCYLAGVLMLLVAGVIEFWFDKHYEGQGFGSNLHDFEDYTIGVFGSWLLALLVHF